MGEDRKRKHDDETYEQPVDFLKRHGLEEFDTLVARRKAVWLGHAERAKDKMALLVFDLHKQANDRWWTNLNEELAPFGLTADEARELKDEPVEIKRRIRTVGRLDAAAPRI